MAAYSEVEFTLSYDDETTSKLTLGPLDTDNSALYALKANVMYFNANFTSDTATLSLSKYGNTWNGISAVKTITTDKTILF